MTTDTLVQPALPATAPAPTGVRGRVRQLGIDTGYTLTNFPVGVAAFVVVLTGLALGAGLLVIWVGVAVLAATLMAARGFATIERAYGPSGAAILLLIKELWLPRQAAR